MPLNLKTFTKAGRVVGRKTRAALARTAKAMKSTAKLVREKNPLSSWLQGRRTTTKKLLDLVNQMDARISLLEQSQALNLPVSAALPVRETLQEMSAMLEGIKASIGAGKSNSIVIEICPLCKQPVAAPNITAVLIETKQGISRVCKTCLDKMMRRGNKTVLASAT